MPDEHAQTGGVPEFRAVTGGESNGHITDRLNRARAQEYLLSQMFGVSVAMGSVWAGRRFAPKQMDALAKGLEHIITPHMKGESPGFIADEARRMASYGVMFAAGLGTSMSTQISLARTRREGMDHAGDISLGRDIARVLTGWSIGAFGAGAAVALADRYLRRGSRHAVSDILTRAEELLDAQLLNGAEFSPGNRVSEGLVSNLTMIAGACPVSVGAQRLYDEVLCHPAYSKDVRRR